MDGHLANVAWASLPMSALPQTGGVSEHTSRCHGQDACATTRVKHPGPRLRRLFLQTGGRSCTGEDAHDTLQPGGRA